MKVGEGPTIKWLIQGSEGLVDEMIGISLQFSSSLMVNTFPLHSNILFANKHQQIMTLYMDVSQQALTKSEYHISQ